MEPEPEPAQEPEADNPLPLFVRHSGSGDNIIAQTVNQYPPGPPPLGIPHQLPDGVSRFIGRHDEIAALDAFLNDRRTLFAPVTTALIVGTAGVGKTGLAVRWAHRVAGKFPDGQLYVDMYSYSGQARKDPREVLGTFLAALDVPAEKIPFGLDERAALFRSKTAERRLLVLIDNVDSVRQMLPLQPGSGGSIVIATSRDDLSGLDATVGARSVRLKPLALPDACELLGAIAGADRVGEDEDATAEIARLCGHLPLALRIVAARIASDPYTPLAIVVSTLADERKRLEMMVTADSHIAVRAVFSWSYQRLSDGLARTFRILGLHPGPEVGIRAAAAVTDRPERQASEDLARLVGFNLLTRIARDRYAFYDLLKVYAVDLAHELDSDDDRARVLVRTVDFYLHSAAAAERHFSKQGRRVSLDPPAEGSRPWRFVTYQNALDWCETERTNIAATTRTAATAGLLNAAWQLPVCMARFYYLRKHWSDWVDLHEVGLDAATRLGDQPAQAWGHNNLGNAHYDLQQYEAALRHHLLALRIRHDIGDTHGEAISRLNVGEVYRAQGRELQLARGTSGDPDAPDGGREFAKAVDNLRQAAERFASLAEPDPFGQAMAISNVANALREAGRPAEAKQAAVEALEIHRDDAISTAFMLNNLGDICRDLRSLKEANDYLGQALAIREELQDEHNTAVTLVSIGYVARDLGDKERAATLWERAAQILDQIDDERAAVVRALIREL